MKKTNLLKLALCAMTLLPIGAWAADFGTEKVVSTTKTWTFDGLTASTVYNAITCIDDEYYLRTSSSNPNRYFTVSTDSEVNLTFSDGYVVKVQNYLQANAAMQNYNDTYLKATQTAGNDDLISSRHSASCSFAFNASVPGTVYVYGTNAEDNKKVRIVFTDGTNKKVTDKNNDGALALTEVTYTSTAAGSFFIGGPESTFRIYAVRFVPTSEKPFDIVYIGATGYATYGNNSSNALALPTGLTAYNAKSNGTSVTLTSVEMIRPTCGYVIKGTANTNYSLFTTTDNGDKNQKGGEMVRVNADIENFPSSITDGDTYYQYFLGADGTTAKFYSPNGTSTLAKGKAYLKTKTQLTTSAHGFDIVIEDGGTTAISEVRGHKEEVRDYYNLSGQRVSQPTRGLYIVNGKKVIIK